MTIEAENHNKPQNKKFLSRRKIILTAVCSISILIFLYGAYILQGMPDLTELENARPAEATRIYSADGKVIHELFIQNRIWLSFGQIPEHAIQAALATEDRAFYQHWGIALKRVVKPIVVNLFTMRYQEGFSTITMQVARNLYVKKIGFERNITRKIREILTAIQIERTYSKQEILEMYLNIAWFGRGAYGIQQAAQNYFRKDAVDLKPEESALLIALLKGPAIYSPINHPERAIGRRNLVLHNMVVCGYLTTSHFDTLKTLPLTASNENATSGTAPYFTEYVRQQLNELQETIGFNVYEDGLNVYTTLNTIYQVAIDSAITNQMPMLQKSVTLNLKNWKEKEELSDSTFTEKSGVQIAFVALDHETGEIKAMVGGRDFSKSKFNRAVQARRQPGSTFKPFVYAAAIDNGYTPADKLLNQPVVLTNTDGTRWTPENFDHSFGGLMTLREGLRHSKNLVTTRLILEVGPQVVADYARQLGISTPLAPYPSLAMGSTAVVPLEMVSAFGVFANGGVRVEPVAILRIEDRNGNILYEHHPQRREALNRSTAYIITDMLQDVVDHGTGRSIRWKYNWQAPVAGKTGTTNDYADAWFIGFTPHLTAGVWVGLDDPVFKLGRGHTGAGAALPFWAEFMKKIYKDLDIPEESFRQPSDIIRLDICDDSGQIATNFCPKVIKNEVFKATNHPQETCELHPGIRRRVRKSRTMF